VHVFGEASLKHRKVLVQGAGSVGGILIAHLLKAGAEVLFSEMDEVRIQRFRDELGLPLVPVEDIYRTQCDVFAPCALGGVLNENTIPRLQCRIVAGGANNQLAQPQDAERLRARAILYAPDYVVNVGGAMAIPGIENQGWSQAEAEAKVVKSVRHALKRIFEMAQVQGIPTDEAAHRIAEENLSKDT
jgi:leucine dehydrogenase